MATLRDHLELSASRGNEYARQALIGPEFPEPLEYLHHWALSLHGRSGFGQHGVNPLTYGTIADWSRLTDQYPEPHEVDALFQIDAAMIYTPEVEEKKAPESPEAPKVPWPKRKAS